MVHSPHPAPENHQTLSEPPQSAPSHLATSREIRVRELLRAHLVARKQVNPDKNMLELLDLDAGFVGRFEFFVPLLPASAKKRLLISGCAVGSELVVARRFGFEEAYGTEVSRDLVNIAKIRLEDDPKCLVTFYEGTTLPYADEFFSAVYSGHVIEHTPDPFAYFAEHMRTLKTGGYFFLEFPNRYHHTELHTGTWSFEWLPAVLRAAALAIAAHPLSPSRQDRKDLYGLVRRTLQPISVWQIRSYLRRLKLSDSRIIAAQRPAPGFVRVLIRK